jgi:hypothetical protein
LAPSSASDLCAAMLQPPGGTWSSCPAQAAEVGALAPRRRRSVCFGIGKTRPPRAIRQKKLCPPPLASQKVGRRRPRRRPCAAGRLVGKESTPRHQLGSPLRLLRFQRSFRQIAVTAQVVLCTQPVRNALVRIWVSCMRAWMTFHPCFLAVEMKERMMAKSKAPSRLRKLPEIFCLTFIMRTSRSA